jgi:sugar diacid utilization regulator
VSDPPAALPPRLAQLFEIVLNAADADRSLRFDELEVFRQAGADAARQGHNLGSVIDAYLRGAGELWEQVLTDPGIDRRPVLDRGRTLRRVSEDAVVALASGYEDVQRRAIRAEEAVRRDLLDELLSERGDPTVIHQRARQLQVPLDHDLVVAVARNSGRGAGGAAHDWAERAVRSRLGPQAVTATHRGVLVVVAPAGQAGVLAGIVPTLRSAQPGRWRVGLGRVHPGVAGVARSYAEAREALELAERLERPDPVATWEQMLPYRVVSADPVGGRALVEAVITPLARAPRGSLVPTLEAFVDCGGNMAEMARALALSPRAVAYRLERIARLTGRSLRDPEGRFVLELGLRCHRLLGGR